jgi:integrase
MRWLAFLREAAEGDPIPKERMKCENTKRREHVVPLSKRCLQTLKAARTLDASDELLLPGPRGGEELSGHDAHKGAARSRPG